MPQKKQNLKWKRVSRTVGKGTWKPQGKGKEVFDNNGRLMGCMKSLKYTYGKSDNKNANGKWLMTEYSLYDGNLHAREIKNKGYVICKIKKRKPNDHNENGVSDENMNNVEELIDSSLQLEDNINVEEDNVGDEVLAILDKEDDGVRKGDRAALASDAILDAALRRDGDRKMDLAAAMAMEKENRSGCMLMEKRFTVEMKLQGFGLNPRGMLGLAAPSSRLTLEECKNSQFQDPI
ncbi:hypothetical protein MTR67_032661 [Solanum verrucosum]|uniref:NAC domain-containing protein n=1 Tax=Solanum verrucosum TaxID=315347 RepID=A0AAF0U4Z1_SOLVR|nr:hypothetical protein MTR67_032661 [Solanum verrucosum]